MEAGALSVEENERRGPIRVGSDFGELIELAEFTFFAPSYDPFR